MGARAVELIVHILLLPARSLVGSKMRKKSKNNVEDF